MDDMNGWHEWFAGPCPVPVGQRVECVLYNGTLANGLALAFNWRDMSRSDFVERWRLVHATRPSGPPGS